MLVWGGAGINNANHNTGARYNPATDSWTAMTTVNAPAARHLPVSVWTGVGMIVWGGGLGGVGFNTGGCYDPVADTWAALSTTPAPAGRYFDRALWTGSKMIVTDGCPTPSNPIYGVFNDTWCYVPGVKPVDLGCNPTNVPDCDPTIAATDNCGVPSVTCMKVDTTNGCARTRTITYTAVDACSNSNTCAEAFIWKEDTTPPTLVCASNKVVQCGTTWSFNPPTASDTCGTNVTVTVLGTVTNGTCPQVFTRTWRAIDGCGNSNTCSQTVTVVDTTPPVLTCASNKTVECGAAWSFDEPTATDVCCGTNVTISMLDTVATGTCPQVITRTWQATDCCSNSATCSQSVTVLDTTPPELTCPGNFSVTCTNEAGATVAYTVTATDLCDTNVSVTCVPPSGSLFPKGATTVHCTAVDACGNSNTCSFTVTVTCCARIVAEQLACPTNGSGNFTYTFTLQNLSGTNASYLFLVPLDPLTLQPSTNCLSVSPGFIYLNPPLAPGASQTFTVTLKPLANCGTNVCLLFTMHAEDFEECCAFTHCLTLDTVPPVVTCAPDKTLQCPAQIAFDTPTAYDACCGTNVTITVVSNYSPLGTPCSSSATRIWRITDCAFNSVLCTQTLTRVDTTPPVFSNCASNKTVECGGPEWSFDEPTASDACWGTNVTVISFDTVGSTGCLQTITRTWQATDFCGNTATCSQTVTVGDTTPPFLTCPSDKTVECSGPEWTFGEPTVLDTCSGTNVTLISFDTVGSTGCVQTITRTWQATDCGGNSATCSQTVTVSPPRPCVRDETWTPHENQPWHSVASSTNGSKLVAVESGGRIYTSTDSGVTWTPRESGRRWQSAASSADGSKLVATVYGGRIYTSTDSGVTWTPRESIRPWRSVASSADGSKLVAVTDDARIYTSTDSGVTWIPRESNRNWASVASSADGSKLVAVVFGGRIYTSPNSGVTWTARESNRRWHSVASSGDGTKLVAVVYPGRIYTSTDGGMTWVPQENSRNWVAVTSSADGSKLVALEYSGRIYTTTDFGGTWTPRDSIRAWGAVASSADGSKLVALENPGVIYTSTDSGGTWMARDINPLWRSVASSSDGSKLAAVVSGGQIYTSPDSGTTWVPQANSRNWISIASSADGGKLAAVVYGGQIFTSPDSGGTWTAGAPIRDWDSVASSADGSKLVAGINFGPIFTSSDSGGTWTAQNSGNRFWSSVASSADGSKLVAVEYQGRIYISTDSGVSWAPQENSRQWFYVASSADGNKLVAVEYQGRIYISTDSGATWAAQESSRDWYSVAASADGNKLVAAVNGGRIYTSMCMGAAAVAVCAPDKTVDHSSAWSFDPPTGASPCCPDLELLVLVTVTNGVCPQVITRTWLATACCTNSALCSQTVTVVDTRPPVITCPTNVTAYACGNSTPVSYATPTLIAGCATITCVPPSKSSFALGVTPVVCTATDAQGNTDTCSFTVTVLPAAPNQCFNLGIAIRGTNLEISWPDTVPNITIECAASLEGDGTNNWVPVDLANMTNAGGMNKIIIELGEGTMFFRGLTN